MKSRKITHLFLSLSLCCVCVCANVSAKRQKLFVKKKKQKQILAQTFDALFLLNGQTGFVLFQEVKFVLFHTALALSRFQTNWTHAIKKQVPELLVNWADHKTILVASLVKCVYLSIRS